MKTPSKFEQLKDYITANAQRFRCDSCPDKCDYTYENMEFDALYMRKEVPAPTSIIERFLGITNMTMGAAKSGGVEYGLFIDHKQVKFLSEQQIIELWSILENR